MITPTYFFLSLLETAKRKMEKIAFTLGLAFAIPLTIWSPNLALIGSGLVGGTIAYVIVKKEDQDDK